MGNYTVEDNVGETQLTCDCEMIRFRPDDNVRDYGVLCLMSTHGLHSNFAGLVRNVNAWDLRFLEIM